MSRFAAVTILALLGLLAIGGLCHGQARLWLCASIALAYAIACGLGVAFIRMRFFCDAVCRGRADRMRVALTFDDGPDSAATPELLDLLRDERIPATFFCIGRRALEHRSLTARIFTEGHLVANHTFRHAWWTNFLAGPWLLRELEAAQRAITECTGTAPGYIRTPMGLTSPHCAGAAKRLGLTLVGWDVRGLDRGAEPDAVVHRVVRKARGGSIILLHDGGADPRRLTVLVRGIIVKLREKGYEFVRIDHLLNDTSATASSEHGGPTS